MTRRWPVFLLLLLGVVVAETGKQAPLLLRLWFWLIVQPYIFEALLWHLIRAFAVLLHRRAGGGARAAHIEGASGVY